MNLRRSVMLLLLPGALCCSVAARLQPAFGASIEAASTPYHRSLAAAGNSHAPTFSADGRFLAFLSQANNVATNDDNGPHLDLFLREIATSNTVLVSVSASGFGGANDNVRLAVLSSNAQVIAFEADATNLAGTDSNRVSDIYARDRAKGTTVLVSVDRFGVAAGNGRSYNPLLSADGRYVVFESLASNLVTNDFNGTNDLFIRDLEQGVTRLVSVNAEGTGSPAGPSHSASISADGKVIAFVSHATNLVDGVTNRLGEVYVRHVVAESNRWLVGSHLLSTWLRGAASGQPVSYRAFDPVISGDGHYVGFKADNGTLRYDLQRGTNRVVEIFPSAGPRAAQVFEDNPRLASSASTAPLRISHSGRYLVYETRSSSLPPFGIVRVDFEQFQTNVVYTPPLGGTSDPGAYITNINPSAVIVVTNSLPSGQDQWNALQALVADRTADRIVFAADLAGTGGPRSVQVYSVEGSGGEVRLVSGDIPNGRGPDLADASPALSEDGTRVAWDSPDVSFLEGDRNRAWDVLLRNADDAIALVSAAHPNLPPSTGPGYAGAGAVSLSADGRRVAYISNDASPTPDDQNFWGKIFVRTIGGGAAPDSVIFSPSNYCAAPVLSSDGRFLAYAHESRYVALNNSTNRTVLWRDLAEATNHSVSSSGGFSPDAAIMHPAGVALALSSPERLDPSVQESGDIPDIFVVLIGQTNRPPGAPQPLRAASTIPSGTAIANGPSRNPVFSPDGRWIVFESEAGNLVDGLSPRGLVRQLFARSFGISNITLEGSFAEMPRFGPTRLISHAYAGDPTSGLPEGARSAVFSADSRFVVFVSGTNRAYLHRLVETEDIASLTNNANLLVCEGCIHPFPSGNGRWVAFATDPIESGRRDVMVKDLETGLVELVSVNLQGTGGGNGVSSRPLLTHDGRYVVFTSTASDLVGSDNNRATDVFLRDRRAGVTHCLSRNWQGTATGNRASSHPVLAADGRTIAFRSFASDLIPGDYNATRDVFVVRVGTSADSDNDGMDDEWEVTFFETLDRDGRGDFDEDGLLDRDEYQAATNPADGDSVLRVTALTTVEYGTVENGLRTTVILWKSSPGKRYRVQTKAEMDADWQDLDGEVVASGLSASFTDSAFHTAPLLRRFYRVVIVP